MSQNLAKSQISEKILKQLEEHVGHDLEFFQIFKNTNGTRFTTNGFYLARNLWKIYPIKFKKEYKVLNKTLLLLNERMEWPYYLSKYQLVLFNEMDAFEFTLYQGDINLWANKF
jgi:hypothetical protein